VQHATSLRVLDLHDNLLQALPDWCQVKCFPYLICLNLNKNGFITLPLCLGRFATLRFLSATLNQGLTYHQKVHAKSRDPRALLRYITDCAAGETQPQNRFRMMLLGEPNVGKSALVECLKATPSFFQRRLNHRRARTQYPVIHTVERNMHQSDTVWHALITDPPGTYCFDLLLLGCLLDARCHDQVTPRWLLL